VDFLAVLFACGGLVGVDTRATVYGVFVLSYLSLNCNFVMCIFLKCMMQLLIFLAVFLCLVSCGILSRAWVCSCFFPNLRERHRRFY
jgi:hypothetical protein